MADNPITTLGELSKPATILVEKISDALGGAFRPYQIKRVARAEAEAAVITAEAEIEVTALHRRAAARWLNEQARIQANIEAITAKAIPLLTEKARPQAVDADWFANFFEKSRIISDEQMQHLWSKILAGEANSPGSFSRRTVTVLSDLEKSDAALFTTLCSFVWDVAGENLPFVLDLDDTRYTSKEIKFRTLIHLESLGLIQLNAAFPFALRVTKRCLVSFFGQSVELVFDGDEDNSLEFGAARLTRAGQELSRVCAAQPADGFYEYMCATWSAMGLIASRPPSQEC